MNEFKNIKICDECRSEYFAESSKMSDLCPDCSHYLYGYENCNHTFENGRCIYCYWNGFSSDFINKNFKDTSYMNNLKQSFLNLIKYLIDENIIVNVDIDLLTNKNFYELVLFLKNIFKEQYPKTKLKPIMKSIHYANSFENEELKQSAYLLDDIEQYLTINKFLNHDSSVEFFNKKITTKYFVITPENLVATSIESLMLAKKRRFLIRDNKFMNYLLKKEDFILNESKYVSDYEFEDENIKVTIYKEDFTKEEIDFTNKLINLYEENLPKIALACVGSDTFKYCYPDENIESIISKLGKPIFRRM